MPTPTGVRRPFSSRLETQTAQQLQDRQTAIARNAVTVKVARINNGFIVVEMGTGEQYAYPDLGITMPEGDDPMNVGEHLATFFASLEA